MVVVQLRWHCIPVNLFKVLMRALRDFNLPKIITDDVPIIMASSGPVPSLNVPRKRDLEFEEVVKKSMTVSACVCVSWCRVAGRALHVTFSNVSLIPSVNFCIYM